MRIEFTTARGTGYVEIPDDTVSIKIPEGINKDAEILTHGVFTNQQDVMATTKDVVDPAKEKVVEDEDGLEKMIPNL